MVMGLPGLSCFGMRIPALERLISGMDCGYPQRMWAGLNGSNNSSLVTDSLCDQIGAGNMASVCVLRLSCSESTIRGKGAWATVRVGYRRVGTDSR